MTTDQFNAQLKRLEEAFGKKYPSEMTRILFRRLHRHSLKVIEQAVENLLCEEKFLPRWKEIQAAVALAAASQGSSASSRPAAETKCRLCMDSGIKLRACRSNLVRDFYCICEAAASMTKHDWTVPEWAATITGFEHLPLGKPRNDVRFAAARVALAMDSAKQKAEGTKKSGFVDMATGNAFSILGDAGMDDLMKLKALRAQLAAKLQQHDDEVPF